MKETENQFFFLKEKQKIINYLALPRAVLDMGLGESTIILYALLLDRARVSSIYEEWIDDNGNAFIRFTIDQLAKNAHKGKTTVKSGLQQLEECGLIQRVHQGIGKANRIYVMIPEASIPTTARPENGPRQGRKTGHYMVGNPATNKTILVKQPQYNNLNYYEDEENLSL